jgi:SOS-response transcriptional repressor LexA
VFLDPANERYEPIELTADVESRVMGKVVTVLRSLG